MRGEDRQGSSGWKRENGSRNAGESGILPLAGWIQLGGDQRDPGNTGIREQPEKDIGDPPGDCTDQEHGTYRIFGRTAGKCGKKYRQKYGKKYGNSFRQKYGRTSGEPHGVSGTGRRKKRFRNGIQGNH